MEDLKNTGNYSKNDKIGYVRINGIAEYTTQLARISKLQTLYIYFKPDSLTIDTAEPSKMGFTESRILNLPQLDSWLCNYMRDKDFHIIEGENNTTRLISRGQQNIFEIVIKNIDNPDDIAFRFEITHKDDISTQHCEIIISEARRFYGISVSAKYSQHPLNLIRCASIYKPRRYRKDYNLESTQKALMYLKYLLL